MIKKLLLILLTIPLILIVVPQFSIAGERIEYIDTYFKEQNVSISNFKKGYGLYESSKVTVEYISNVDNTLKEEEFNYISKVLKNRLVLSDLIDISLKSRFENNKYTFEFELPNYYQNPSTYVDWLLADGEIAFSTAEESSVVLDINDYDILGEISVDYLPQAGSNLVFDFEKDLEITLNSAFATNQNSIFYMSIDDQISYFITPFDQYVETKPTTVRAFPAISSITTLQELNDYLRISRSYFASDTINLSDYNKSISVETIPPIFKNTSLTITSLSFIFFAFIPLFILVYISKNELLMLPRREFFKYLIKRSMLIILFNLILLFLLKFSGAVLSIYLLLGYLLSITVFEYLILNFNNLKNNLNIYLLTFFVLILLALKFSYLTYELSNILAVIQFSIVSFWLTNFYYNSFKFLKLDNEKE